MWALGVYVLGEEQSLVSPLQPSKCWTLSFKQANVF